MSVWQMCGVLLLLNAAFWPAYGVFVLLRWLRSTTSRRGKLNRWYAELTEAQARAVFMRWIALDAQKRRWVYTHFSLIWARPLLWLISR